MSFKKTKVLTRPLQLGIAFFAAIVLFSTPMVWAGKDCAFFTVTIGSRTFTPGRKGDLKITLPASQVNGQIAQVRGTYVEFDVELDTFTVRNYTLTGVAAPDQITNLRTPVFVSKAPDALLNGSLALRVRTSGQHLVMERSGPGVDMKIQAKDCDQGGIFQLEPEPRRNETNTLAPGFRYCFQATPSSRKFFTNGIVLGYDSPQDATLVSGSDITAVWSVQAGGRIGMVIGEDAVEALQLESPVAITACPHQTP